MVGGFKIGFMPMGSYLSKSTSEICGHLKTLGYDAVEWNVNAVCPRKNKDSVLSGIFRDTKNSGLEVSEITVQRDMVLLDEKERQDNIKYTVECIETFSSFGVTVFNIFTGPVPWIKNPLVIGTDVNMGEAWNMVFDAVDQLLPVAKKNNAVLALESVWGMLAHDFYTAKFLIDRYQSPNLGINFDPSHDILSGNYDVGWIIRQWGSEKIAHVHLKDAAGIQKKDRFVFPLLGEGNVDWKAFKEAMAGIGYSGVMSVEFESFTYLATILGGSMEDAAQISMDNIKKLFL